MALNPVATTTQARQSSVAWLKQLQITARRPGDFLFRGVVYLFVAVVLLVVAGVGWVLVSQSWPSIQAFGFSYLTFNAFDPNNNRFGVGPAIFGTIVTSGIALLIAAPVGIGSAIFLVDVCPRRLRASLAFVVDTIAAIPSVVIGLWGVFVFAPWMQLTGEPWLQTHLGFLPFFQGTPHGYGLLAASLILAFMILPILTAIAREVMLVVPVAQREALLALGATRWEVIRHAVLPFSLVGIAGAAILALGRALGETMAVTMLIGNQGTHPGWSLFDTGYTLASVIANQFGEATPGFFVSAVIEAGLLLLIITLITNVLARVLLSRISAPSHSRRSARRGRSSGVASLAGPAGDVAREVADATGIVDVIPPTGGNQQ